MDSTLHIRHTLDAPPALVWQAISEPEHLAQWWGPAGLGLEVVSLDFTPGGHFHYAMLPPDGQPSYGRFDYEAVDEASHRLHFTNGFADAAGQIIAAPFGPDFAAFPLRVHNRWRLEATPTGGTELIMEGRPHEALPASHAFFAAMHDNMRQGFGGTFARLEGYLAAKQGR